MSSFTTGDFPIISASLKGRDVEYFSKALESINESLAKQRIANPVYIDFKQRLNRIIQESWTKHVSDPYFYEGRFRDQPEAVREVYDSMIYPQLHTTNALGKRLKAAAGKASGSALDAMVAFHAELVPLSAAFEQLKPFVVKRQVKDAAEVEAEKRALPPHVDKDSAELVKGLLTELVEANYRELVQAYVEWAERVLSSNLEEDAKRDPAEKRKILKDPSARDIVYACTEVGPKRTDRMTRRSNADEVIAGLATRHAELVRDAFVYKNLKKLASIIAIKGNLSEASVAGYTVSLNGLEGSFHFRFADESAFTATNSVVFSQSIHGVPFQRFPLTFHRVSLPGGEPMRRPSEEKINTEFLQVQPAVIKAPRSAQQQLRSLGAFIDEFDEDDEVFALRIPVGRLDAVRAAGFRLEGDPDVKRLAAAEPDVAPGE